jgi:hypothetical protein
VNGYRYTNWDFVEIHLTSVPQTDEAAIEYISQIEKWFPKSQVMFIEKRDAGQRDWRLIHRAEEQDGCVHVLHSESLLVPVPIARPSELEDASATDDSQTPRTTGSTRIVTHSDRVDLEVVVAVPGIFW